MATEIRMPDLGTAAKEVTIVKWLKETGAVVARGEPLCEVETDKATSELESVAEGVLLKRMVDAGAVVATGDVIAYVGAAGETVKEAEPTGAATAAPQAPEAPEAGQPATGAVKTAPLIRNLAQRAGIDLSKVAGSGPGGRITREDVRRAQQGAPQRRSAETNVRLSKNQLAVARTISESWREIIPLSVTGKISMAAARALRQRHEQRNEKISYDAVLVRAVAQVIRERPRFRAHFQSNALVQTEHVNVGLAISIDEDLYIPVIRDADRQALLQLERYIRALAQKAREKRLTEQDITGATFTISNLGMFPIESFTAIIPPRQSGVLTVGTVEEEVKMTETGGLRSTAVARVILSVDHRFINGRQAAEFLTGVKQKVEEL